MTEDEEIDVWCIGRVNSLGKYCPEGSYIGLVYKDGGVRHSMRVSTGHAENLIAEMQAALSAPAPKAPPLPMGTRIHRNPPT
jgi:hypothetical protein